MAYRNFTIGENEKREIFIFDLLYRLNAKRSLSVLLDREQEFLESSFQLGLNEKLILINEHDEYELSQKGKEALIQYGKMFQRFKDLSIFKCVFSDAPEPDEGEVDERFGAYDEVASPPDSEDYRVLIFENFCSREKRKAPLHLFVFFSLIENLNLENDEDDWVWSLASGELFNDLKEIIDTQLNATALCPPDWSENEIVDEIYSAGMRELKRCYESDQAKYDFNNQCDDQDHFWKEDCPRDPRENPREHSYYEPYWEPRVGLGSALCVGAFAGLATCALLG